MKNKALGLLSLLGLWLLPTLAPAATFSEFTGPKTFIDGFLRGAEAQLFHLLPVLLFVGCGVFAAKFRKPYLISSVFFLGTGSGITAISAGIYFPFPAHFTWYAIFFLLLGVAAVREKPPPAAISVGLLAIIGILFGVNALPIGGQIEIQPMAGIGLGALVVAMALICGVVWILRRLAKNSWRASISKIAGYLVTGFGVFILAVFSFQILRRVPVSNWFF